MPFTMMLEPWGEDYWIQPGEEFDVVAESADTAFHYVVVDHPDYVAVYAEGRCESVSVFQKGQRLKCGHQKPPNARKTWQGAGARAGWHF